MSKEPELNGFVALVMHPWVGLPDCAGIAIYFGVNLWLVLVSYVALFVFWIKNFKAAEKKWRKERNDN